MPQISKFVRDAIKAQLSAETTGFNDRLADLAKEYGIESWAIDWTPESANFIFGRIAPAAVEQSSVMTFPFTTIDCMRSQNVNRIKYATFSGPVFAVIEVHHSWPDESVLADFASFVDATEDAMVSCLNDKATQTWPGNLLWNGAVTVTRGSVAFGAQNFLQSALFTCQFDLTV